jgi:hypothetical protein
VVVNRRRGPVGALAAASLVLLASCGVPVDATARSTDPADVPFDLLSREPTGTVSPGPRLAAVQVFFVRGGRLWPEPRTVPAPASPRGALSALAEGPTSAERDQGLRTELLVEDAIGSVRGGGGVVQVDVAPGLADLPSERQVLAVAQIVLTVAAAEPGASVAITIDGEPISVPLPDGPSSTHPVGGEDYLALVGPGPS